MLPGASYAAHVASRMLLLVIGSLRLSSAVTRVPAVTGHRINRRRQQTSPVRILGQDPIHVIKDQSSPSRSKTPQCCHLTRDVASLASYPIKTGLDKRRTRSDCATSPSRRSLSVQRTRWDVIKGRSRHGSDAANLVLSSRCQANIPIGASFGNRDLSFAHSEPSRRRTACQPTAVHRLHLRSRLHPVTRPVAEAGVS